MYYLYSGKILEEEFSTDEESDITAYDESDIIATGDLEGSAERYGNAFLLNWKQCVSYPLLMHTACKNLFPYLSALPSSSSSVARLLNIRLLISGKHFLQYFQR